MPAKKKSVPPVAKSFEAATEELEEITRRLEEDDIPLDRLLKEFERGQKLLTYCQKTLHNARKRLDFVEAKLSAEPPEEEDETSSLDDAAPNDDDDVRLF